MKSLEYEPPQPEIIEKLVQLVLYIAEKSREDLSFGSTKLNKILFAIDFNYFGSTGESITGAVYVHQERGPVPKIMPGVLQYMVGLNMAAIEDTEYFGYRQKRVVPRIKPDMSDFDEEEIEYADKMIEHFRPFSATELTEWTHELDPWILTENGEEIPYYSVFILRNLRVEKSGVKWAMQELRRLRKEEEYAH